MSGRNSPERERALEAQTEDPWRDLKKLPDDLLYAIFKPRFHADAGELASVSKRWRDRFQPPSCLWDDVALTIYPREKWQTPISEQYLKEAASWLKKRIPVAKRLSLMLDHGSFANWTGFQTSLRREIVEAFQSADLKALKINIPYCTQWPGDLQLLAPHLTSLKSLIIHDHYRSDKYMEHWKGLQALTVLTGLRQLFVEACRFSVDQTAFPSALLALTELRELALVSFYSKAVPNLSSLARLQALELDSRVTGDALAGLNKLTFLKYTAILDEDFEGLRFPASLREVHISLPGVPPELSACTALTRLELININYLYTPLEAREAGKLCACCQGLAKLLVKMPLLERLRLEHFNSSVIPAISVLKKLQHLDIRLCGDEFKGLLCHLLEGDWMTRLKVLRLGNIKSLPMRLAKAANLEVLDLSTTQVESCSVKHFKLMLRLPKLKQVVWPEGIRGLYCEWTGNREGYFGLITRRAEKLQELLKARNPQLKQIKYYDSGLDPELLEMKTLAEKAWRESVSCLDTSSWS